MTKAGFATGWSRLVFSKIFRDIWRKYRWILGKLCFVADISDSGSWGWFGVTHGDLFLGGLISVWYEPIPWPNRGKMARFFLGRIAMCDFYSAAKETA